MTTFARFMNKVEKQSTVTSPHVKTPCWLWTGSQSGSGYGQFWNGTRTVPAHWFLVVDFMPAGKEGCHKCDNKLCVNPEHIFVGSRVDNVQDCVNKGRLRPKNGCLAMLKHRKIQRGVNNHECKLTVEQAMLCRACPHKYGVAQAMARKFGVSLTVVVDIRNGKRWTHLPEPSEADRQRAEAFLRTYDDWEESK